jgi:thiol-disulfide isomerase/thioredoxin
MALLPSACTNERVAHADCFDQDDCRPKVAMAALDGTQIADEVLAGKVVLVNFWATWCAPCKKELPALQAVYDRHKTDGFTILGVVSSDRASDGAILSFAAQRNVAYPLVRGQADLERRFAMGDALPTSMLYDRHGHLVKRWMGDIEEGALEDLVKKTLAQ